MSTIRYTLLSDGSSDRLLMPILNWLLYQHCPEEAVEATWADLGRLPRPPKMLSERISTTLDLYSCDILFIHRDAEKDTDANRRNEIVEALAGLVTPPVVCVIPVRMQEAWLLFDEAAIRRASGNPKGTVMLNLPNLRTVENLPDPKECLFNLIRTASELRGARLKKLNPRKCAYLLSELLDDFSALRTLTAFRTLEADIKRTVTEKMAALAGR